MDGAGTGAENAECANPRGVDRIDRLTVLGVDPDDARLGGELWRYVPDEADAVYRTRFEDPRPAALVRVAFANPPVAATVLALVALRRGRSPRASAAVTALGEERSIPVVELDLDPLGGVAGQGWPWTLGAWVATGAFLATTLALVLVPGPLTAALAFVSVPLAAAYVLAHGGAHIRRRDAAIAAAVLDRAARAGHDRPVLVVRERHVPGVADRAKDRRVPTHERTVSTELTADASLY